MSQLVENRTSKRPAKAGRRCPTGSRSWPVWPISQGLKGAAKRTGIGGSTISQLLSNKYPAATDNQEARVRGAIMHLTVDCPVLGEMGRDVCLKWQAKPFAATSSLRVAMYRACRAPCPHSKFFKGETHDV